MEVDGDNDDKDETVANLDTRGQECGGAQMDDDQEEDDGEERGEDGDGDIEEGEDDDDDEMNDK